MFRRKRRESDFDSEIQAHIQLEADRLQDQGMSPRDALLAARRSFGNVAHAGEQFYEAGRWMAWDHFRRDLHFAARVLAKDARFSAFAILGLALGIGVSTAIFALINLQVRAESGGREDGSYVGFNSIRQGSPRGFSYPEYLALRDTRSFRDVVAESGWQPLILQPIAPGSDSEDVQGRFVSSNYLTAGGLHCAVGRTFTAEEERTGNPAVTVLDYSLWMQRFAGSPDVLGKSVVLNGRPLVVVGVADPRLMLSPFYLPLALQPALLQQGDWLHDRDRDWLSVEGWLRPGMSVRQSQAEIDVLARALYTDDSRVLITAGGPNPRKRRELMAMMVAVTAAVSMILLIACSNLANLLLAQAVVRRREIGVRLSLGASRLRLISQLMTESLLLSCSGGAVGLLLAYWFAKGALLLVNASPGLLLAYHADPRVALYGVLLSIATGLSFGLAPALAATRTDLAQALHAESMHGTARDRRPWSARNLLVVVPLAVSLMLLLGAGVALRNVQKAYLAGPSFDTSRLIDVSVRLNMQGYDEARTRQFQEDLRARMAATRGVTSLAMATAMPLSNGVGWFPFIAEGAPPRLSTPHTDYNIVSPEFYSTIGVTMVRGRSFTAADREGSEPVALVNQELMRRYWPGDEAIGKRIRLASSPTFFTIVGIAPDMADASQELTTVRPIVYVPYAQGKLFLGGLRGGLPAYQVQFLVRVSGERSGVKAALQQEIFSADPALRVSLRTIQELLEESVGPMRTISLLLSGLGALALLMAAVGIYAILAYTVSQRTREIGIRAALGAQRHEIVTLIMRRTATLIAWGIAGGLFLAFVLTKLFARDMAKFGELDAPICVSVSFVLAAVAMLASFLPARKALRVDPATALRTE